jgi:WD40 repeat protein
VLDGAVKTARIWDRDGTLRAILTGHGDKVHAVAIAPDGSWLATASDDYTARIWDTAGQTDPLRIPTL